MFLDDRFGGIHYPFEEAIVLCAVADHNRFFSELTPCLNRFFPDLALAEDLIRYQKNVFNFPGTDIHENRFDYDWPAYFRDIYAPMPRFPEKKETALRFYPERHSDLADYAKEIIWYGRRSEKMIISKIEYIH